MATWATVRNSRLTNIVSGTARASQFLALLDEHLVTTAGWTRVGSGGGTGSGLYTWGAAKVLPSFATSPGTMATLAWGLYRNATGAEVLFQQATQYIKMWLGPTGGYAVGTSDEDSLPTAPANVITFDATTTYTNIGQSLNQYVQLAYTTDHNSFVVFGSFGGVDNVRYSVVKLEDFKAGDLQPYWSTCYTQSGSSGWNVSHVSELASGTTTLGYHPTTGIQIYTVSNMDVGTTDIFLNQPVDPVSGNYQKMELLCGCKTAGSIHLRGKVPGLYRVSTALNTGDRLSLSGGNYEQVVVGDYALPWNSSDSYLV